MQNVYVVWDIDYDENELYRSKIVDGIYDSEEKAIRAIQRDVKRIRKIFEKLDGPRDHVTYLIDHIPTEEEIRDEGVHYQTIDGCKQVLAYGVYCMN